MAVTQPKDTDLTASGRVPVEVSVVRSFGAVNSVQKLLTASHFGHEELDSFAQSITAGKQQGALLTAWQHDASERKARCCKTNYAENKDSARVKSKTQISQLPRASALPRSKTTVERSRPARGKDYVFQHHVDWREHMKRYTQCHSSTAGGATVIATRQIAATRDDAAQVAEDWDRRKRQSSGKHQAELARGSSLEPTATTQIETSTAPAGTVRRDINLAPVRITGPVGPILSPSHQSKQCSAKTLVNRADRPLLPIPRSPSSAACIARTPLRIQVAIAPQLLTLRREGRAVSARARSADCSTRSGTSAVVNCTTTPLRLSVTGGIKPTAIQEAVLRTYSELLRRREPVYGQVTPVSGSV